MHKKKQLNQIWILKVEESFKMMIMSTSSRHHELPLSLYL